MLSNMGGDIFASATGQTILAFVLAQCWRMRMLRVGSPWHFTYVGTAKSRFFSLESLKGQPHSIP